MAVPPAQGPQQIGTLTALASAREWLASVLARPKARDIALADAQGLVSAADYVAQHAIPAESKALRDGWALSSSLIIGASAYSPVPLPKAPVAVSVGDFVPADCDCVLEPSSIEWMGTMAQAVCEALPGEALRRSGEDAGQGDLLIAEGEMIGPLQQMMLGAAGIKEISCVQPRILLMNVGEADTTTTLLARLIKERGGLPVVSDMVDDLPSAITTHGADLVLVIGGTGAAPTDRSVERLRVMGEVFCHGLALDPGRTAALGLVASHPVIVVPGSPEQALGLWFGLLAPLHDHLTGFQPMRATLPLAAKIASRVGMAELVLLEQQAGQFVPLAIGDMPLRYLARASHILLLDAGSEGHGAGDVVEAVALRQVA